MLEEAAMSFIHCGGVSYEWRDGAGGREAWLVSGWLLLGGDVFAGCGRSSGAVLPVTTHERREPCRGVRTRQDRGQGCAGTAVTKEGLSRDTLSINNKTAGEKRWWKQPGDGLTPPSRCI